MTDRRSGGGERRNVTLVIRAFVNEDGNHYGFVSDPGDPGAAGGWQATFSELDELIALVQHRLGREGKSLNP